MARCRICGNDYLPEVHDIDGGPIDPAEPCWCGEMADASPWEWDRWRGLFNWTRYRLANLLFYLATKVSGTKETEHG